jgi:hypothetical protein
MSKKPFDFGNLVGKKPEPVKPAETTETEKQPSNDPAKKIKREKRASKKQENRTDAKVAKVAKSSKMGRPLAVHNRQPFTSRCNPDTWKKIKALAMARDIEPGEIVEAAFNDYLKRHSADLSGLSDFLKS